MVEVNLAPAEDLEGFLGFARMAYAAAEEVGLAARRFRYNGEVADSGGGGQITLGGPSPAASPFLRHPSLLPSLLRYLNHHPSLSYWFAPECVGSASQGPRPDEGVRERFDELEVALAALERRGDAVTPPELWGTPRPAARRRLRQLAPGGAERREAVEPVPRRAAASSGWSSCAPSAWSPRRST